MPQITACAPARSLAQSAAFCPSGGLQQCAPRTRLLATKLRRPRMPARPERLTLARQQKTPHQDFLFTLLVDECQRRDGAAATTRSPTCTARSRDDSRALGSDREGDLRRSASREAHLAPLLRSARYATIVGAVGVGKRSSPTRSAISHDLGLHACSRCGPIVYRDNSNTHESIIRAKASRASYSLPTC
jgi:hypothetical protein